MIKGIRRPEKQLTARKVETAEPGKHFDGHGLFLRVEKNGSRRWVQRITILGKRREIGLGSPPAVPLATARKMALENRGSAMLGGDPLADKRDSKAVQTFKESTHQYLNTKLHEFRNEKHRKQWRSTLETYAMPILGCKRVSEITLQDILQVLEPIWRDKTETASRLRGRIEAVLAWSTVVGHRTGDNPARWKGNLDAILPKPSKLAKGGNHPALPIRDAPSWFADLHDRAGMATRALEFMVLTAARSGEVRGATWDEIDFGDVEALATATQNGAVWTIPASRMKAGREHRVPLTAEAVTLLQALPRFEGSPYVFPAQKGGQLSDMALSACMKRINASRQEGYLDPRSGRPAVPHGLRSTFRDWCAEQGVDRDMAEIALAHTVGSTVERAYRRSDMLDRRRTLMEHWRSFLVGEQGESKDTLEFEKVAK